MVLFGHQRDWEEDRECAPAGRFPPAGSSAAAPPPFLVYKRRLYVLAKKAPVLDHRQVDIDSIFGPADEAGSRQARPARQPARTAIHRPALQRARLGKSPAQPDDRRRTLRPRFVPRDY